MDHWFIPFSETGRGGERSREDQLAVSCGYSLIFTAEPVGNSSEKQCKGKRTMSVIKTPHTITLSSTTVNWYFGDGENGDFPSFLRRWMLSGHLDYQPGSVSDWYTWWIKGE